MLGFWSYFKWNPVNELVQLGKSVALFPHKTKRRWRDPGPTGSR